MKVLLKETGMRGKGPMSRGSSYPNMGIEKRERRQHDPAEHIHALTAGGVPLDWDWGGLLSSVGKAFTGDFIGAGLGGAKFLGDGIADTITGKEGGMVGAIGRLASGETRRENAMAEQKRNDGRVKKATQIGRNVQSQMGQANRILASRMK